MDPYLAPSTWIDADHPDVLALARTLRGADDTETARRSFEWVRDQVRHSGDARQGPVTCRASHALSERTGYCFAKAHLLVALLRANGIPAGLSYQRLHFDGDRFVLHGLVAAKLPGGWYRMDPRGNKPGVDARFDPPVEHLAFSLTVPGERDVPGVHAEPFAAVVDALTGARTWDEALARLPDAP